MLASNPGAEGEKSPDNTASFPWLVDVRYVYVPYHDRIVSMAILWKAVSYLQRLGYAAMTLEHEHLRSEYTKRLRLRTGFGKSLCY